MIFIRLCTHQLLCICSVTCPPALLLSATIDQSKWTFDGNLFGYLLTPIVFTLDIPSITLRFSDDTHQLLSIFLLPALPTLLLSATDSLIAIHLSIYSLFPLSTLSFLYSDQIQKIYSLISNDLIIKWSVLLPYHWTLSRFMFISLDFITSRVYY